MKKPTEKFTTVQVTANVSCNALCIIKNEPKSVIKTYVFIAAMCQYSKKDDWGFNRCSYKYFPLAKATTIFAVKRLETLGVIEVDRVNGKDRFSGRQYHFGYFVLNVGTTYTRMSTTFKYPKVCDSETCFISVEDSRLEPTTNKKSTYAYIQVDFNRVYKEIRHLSQEDFDSLLHFCYCTNTEPTRTDARIYSKFHSLPSRLRKYCTVNGQHLVEAFDAPCCALLLCVKAFRSHTWSTKLAISEDELNAELDRLVTVIKSDLYTKICEFIKPYILLDTTEAEAEEFRANVKKSMQHWMNILPRFKHSGGWKITTAANKFKFDKCYDKVREYMTLNFPAVTAIIEHYPSKQYIKNDKVKTSKLLHWDFTAVEWQIMSNIVRKLKSLDVIAVSVHDAVYCGEDDLARIGLDTAEQMFWTEYDILDSNTCKRSTVNDADDIISVQKFKAAKKAAKEAAKKAAKSDLK